MSDKHLTIKEVAELLGVLKRHVQWMAEHGVLPHPIMIDGEPHFPEEAILRLREEEDDAVPSAGVYLSTGKDISHFKVVKASYMVIHKNWPFAAFTLWDGSLHIRPWLTHIVDDLPENESILLSCQDENVLEVSLQDLPKPSSIVWGYSWVGQYDLESTPAAPNVSH
ncbi:hypothetical protein MPLA_770071 [Mesorhizobium sp. ORS 3359]|nr:hypothetical protein MPLA_770071 [Mesorhizobium sp. ORS 3359]